MTTDRLSVALLVASTRPGRFADALVPWLEKRLAACSWVDLVVVDLAADTGSPIASRLAYADAFVVLVPEYNHSFPGSLKTAIDAHHAEWARKPVAFVSYGASSGGIRAVEQLRQVFPEVRATTTRNAVALVARGGTSTAAAGSCRPLTSRPPSTPPSTSCTGGPAPWPRRAWRTRCRSRGRRGSAPPPRRRRGSRRGG